MGNFGCLLAVQKTQRLVADASHRRIAEATCGSSGDAVAVRLFSTRSRAPYS